MKFTGKLIGNIALSTLGVMTQGYFSSFHQWIVVYLVIFTVSWFGGMIQGMICTVFSLALVGFYLIPHSQFEFHHAVEFICLTSLGFWVSFLMNRHKKYLVKITANEELDKARTFLDTLIENLPLMVFVKDAKELRFVRFNKAGLELLGFERSELLGKNDHDLFPIEQADSFTKKDREVLAQKGTVDIASESIFTKSNGTRILHTRKIPILDKGGEPLYLLGVSEDITEKIKAEELRLKDLAETAGRIERSRMQERENFVANTISSLSTTIDYQETLHRMVSLVVPVLGDWSILTIVDEEKKFQRVASTHINPMLQPLLDEYAHNYPPGNLDTEIFQALNEGIPTLIKEAKIDYLRSKSSDDRKLELFRSLGTRSSMVIPIKFGAKVLGALSIVRGEGRDSFDELDFMQAQEIGRRAGAVLENSLLFKSTQVAVQARDEFLSIASHELKTPITSLKMQLQMLQRSYSEDRIHRPLGNAVKQIDRLTSLVDDLLNVSKIESGKMSYHFTEVQIGQLLNEILDTLKEQFSAKGVDLRIRIKDDVQIRGDRYRLEQVFVNLLNNSLKYGEGNPVHVDMYQNSHNVVIEIQDHGKGIPLEYHGRIFDKFERARQDHNISGLGLGLFISKQIVTAHHGEIAVESILGKGSKFKVMLPLSINN